MKYMKKKTPQKNTKKQMTVEDLAVIVANGFSDMSSNLDKKFEQVDKRFEKIDQKIDYRFDGLARRIDDLSMNRSTREETKILEMRVERIEKTLKIK